jgi:hypothetical protein
LIPECVCSCSIYTYICIYIYIYIYDITKSVLTFHLVENLLTVTSVSAIPSIKTDEETKTGLDSVSVVCVHAYMHAFWCSETFFVWY